MEENYNPFYDPEFVKKCEQERCAQELSSLITLGDDTVQNLLKEQEDPVVLQEKLKALFSADIKTEDPFPINARELHGFLGIGRDFSNWIKATIEKCDFEEDHDYEKRSPVLASGSNGGQNKIDYHFTVDATKEIAMVQKSALGKLVRRYLIWAEKKLREVAQVIRVQQQPVKFMSNLELMAATVQELIRIDKIQDDQKEQISVLKDTVLEQKNQLKEQQNKIDKTTADIRQNNSRVNDLAYVVNEQALQIDQLNNDISVLTDRISSSEGDIINGDITIAEAVGRINRIAGQDVITAVSVFKMLVGAHLIVKIKNEYAITPAGEESGFVSDTVKHNFSIVSGKVQRHQILLTPKGQQLLINTYCVNRK